MFVKVHISFIIDFKLEFNFNKVNFDFKQHLDLSISYYFKNFSN